MLIEDQEEAERARRHGLSYPPDPEAALAAQIVGVLERGPQSSTRLAQRLDVEELLVIRRLRQLRQDGDVVRTLEKHWRLTACTASRAPPSVKPVQASVQRYTAPDALSATSSCPFYDHDGRQGSEPFLRLHWY